MLYCSPWDVTFISLLYISMYQDISSCEYCYSKCYIPLFKVESSLKKKLKAQLDSNPRSTDQQWTHQLTTQLGNQRKEYTNIADIHISIHVLKRSRPLWQCSATSLMADTTWLTLAIITIRCIQQNTQQLQSIVCSFAGSNLRVRNHVFW